MCESHGLNDISRRGFAAVTVAGAGLSLLPIRAWAAGHTDALCIMCIDYRLIDGAVKFFDADPRAPGTGHYDLAALAGASLAGVLTKFPEAVPGFWNQIALAKQLHGIKRLVVLDHMQCGAYAQQFNQGNPMPPEQERAAHKETMKQVTLAFENSYGKELALEFFLMDVANDKPGVVTRVEV